MGGDQFPYRDTPVSIGESVVVIGAGNTAMDCLRVARRVGAKVVRCVYRRSEQEAPARLEELRHAKEEGIEFYFLHAPAEILVDDSGDVRGIKAQKMALGEPDKDGRRKPIPLDEFVELACDSVIYALGTRPNPIVTRSTPGLALNKWGNIAADDGGTQATSLPGVFAGGDIVTGGATVILAMGAGRRAARSIVAYLRNGKKWPVTQAQADVVASAAPRACGKCRRPLEGDEEYVCCSGAELSWRCGDCGKVSEGFAFPYGLCPACGGQLKSLDGLAASGPASMEAIRAAFAIELGGMAFYARAAAEAPDQAMKDLFARFVVMEKEHMATLARRYHVEPVAALGGFPLERSAIYAGMANRPDEPTNLFQIAIAFEKCAARFFEEHQQTCPTGSPERLLYQELAAEERGHASMLQTELARWKQGKPGLLS